MRIFLITLLFAAWSLSGQSSVNDPFKLVNTSYDEQNPLVSHDGKLLFFTIGNHPLNVGGLKDPGDIWFSRWTGTEWSAPEHGGNAINNRAYNGVAGMTDDSRFLFLLGHYDGSGNTPRTQGLSVSEFRNGRWSSPRNITIPYFRNKSALISGHVVGNSIFVFSAESYGTYGVEDLYISIRDAEGQWSEPRNLGSKINTAFQELSPALSLDGKTLYFSSNGRQGFGSFDVYASTRLDDTWYNWSDPVNLGPDVNTEGRELYYREVKVNATFFYTSTLNSDGYGDIMLKVNDADEQLMASETATVSATTVPFVIAGNEPDAAEEDEAGQIVIHGKVVNAKSSETVNAMIVFSGTATNSTIQTDANGYQVKLPAAGERFNITVTAPGYISTHEKLDSVDLRSREMNFTLQPIEKGATVNLKSVLFEVSTATLLEESYAELDMVVDFMNDNPNVKIGLMGHTDNRGLHAHNVRLSQHRVNRVKEYLISKGIDPQRITGRGYGGIRPIADNSSEETRRLNRRVEFTITQF